MIAQKQLQEKDSQLKIGQEQLNHMYEQACGQLDSAKKQHTVDFAKINDCERDLFSARAEIDSLTNNAKLSRDEALELVTRERSTLLVRTKTLVDESENTKHQYEQAVPVQS